MKKLGIVLIIMLIAISPLMAGTHLINLGYNVYKNFETDYSERGIGLVYTFNGGDGFGFHAQVSPWYCTSWKSGGSVYKMGENNYIGSGLNFILGAGSDINFGNLGLIVGGGLFGATYGEYDIDFEEFYFSFAGGVGGDANLYFQFSQDSPFLINAGFSFAWRPFKYYTYVDGPSDSYFDANQFNWNISVGIGFRN